MRIEFHVTGSDRKALVTAMAEILGVKAKYMGMPSMNYEVDYFTVTKDGTVEFDDRADSEEIEQLLEGLADKGFVAAPAEMAETSHRAKQWGLRWRFPLIRLRSVTLQTFWMPRVVLLRRHWASRQHQSKSARTGFHSLGSKKDWMPMRSRLIATSLLPFAK